MTGVLRLRSITGPLGTRKRIAAPRQIAALALLLAAALSGVAHAQESDSRAARERELLHRAQEALRQSQSENSDLTRAKLDAEQKLKASAEELQKTGKAAKASQAALRAQLQKATDAQTQLTSLLEETRKQLAVMTDKQRESAAQLTAREGELQQVRQDLEKSRTQDASCEAKNLQLYEYARALLDRYHKKGVWDALAQKEPVLGFKEVGLENVVQEYREKLDAQKLSPSGPAPKSP